MAEAALSHPRATIAISVAGVAGPADSSEKPVGLVCFGLAQRGADVVSGCRILRADRTSIRASAVAHAFVMVRTRI
jgi:nicotinamide-nucleotide amidase